MTTRFGKNPLDIIVQNMIVGDKYLVGDYEEGYAYNPQFGDIKVKKLIKKELNGASGGEGRTEEGVFRLIFADEFGNKDKPINRVYDFVYEMVPEEGKTSITGGKRKSRRKRTINKYRKNNRKNKRKTIRRRRHRRNNN